jgi:hypothetical protein
MPSTTLRAPEPVGGRSAPTVPTAPPGGPGPTVHGIGRLEPVAGLHGVHSCSRRVELYRLGIIGPSTMRFKPNAPERHKG